MNQGYTDRQNKWIDYSSFIRQCVSTLFRVNRTINIGIIQNQFILAKPLDDKKKTNFSYAMFWSL